MRHSRIFLAVAGNGAGAGSGSALYTDIKGLRAVAAFLVIAFHARLTGFDSGFLGVDIFFLLSRYSISRIWFRHDQPARDFVWRYKSFVARRFSGSRLRCSLCQRSWH